MSRDQHGVPMSGTSNAIKLYDHALDRLLRLSPEIIDATGALLEQEPDAAMGYAMASYLSLMSTDRVDLEAVGESHVALVALAANERERMHGDAIAAWMNGEWRGAARRLDDLLLRYPGDLLALMLGHQLDFFLGDATNLRDRPARSVEAVDASHPHLGFVRGMQSFGMEESGHYEQAAAAGFEALAVNADDVWAVHAVAHSFEMQGRVDDGIRFMHARVDDWGANNLFTVHLWWHLALYYLEAGEVDKAIEVYDANVHNAESVRVPIEMLDASALLWRLRLDGVDTGNRFAELADAWGDRITEEPWYSFNDLHSTIALVGAGRMSEARALIKRLDAYVGRASGDNARMTSEIALPACRAVVAYADGRHADVVGELAPIRRTLSHFGGSHAQRDVLQRTLVDSAIAAGHHDLARALLAERLGLRGTSVFGWTRRASLATLEGAAEAAGHARRTGEEHRTRFAAAAASSMSEAR